MSGTYSDNRETACISKGSPGQIESSLNTHTCRYTNRFTFVFDEGESGLSYVYSMSWPWSVFGISSEAVAFLEKFLMR